MIPSQLEALPVGYLISKPKPLSGYYVVLGAGHQTVSNLTGCSTEATAQCRWTQRVPISTLQLIDLVTNKQHSPIQVPMVAGSPLGATQTCNKVRW